MIIDLPENVKMIIGKLRAAGYEAFAVGGCVRDSLLGRDPKDWDITTSALPEDIKRSFNRTVDTGIEHGTVTILIGKEAYETTTYRLDGKYSDSRHPDKVEFLASLEEDLRRRDFTINAMAYSDETGLKDIYGGMRDLDDHVIRCVGNAKERFTEDALRILRAVRFAAQLDFGIEKNTLCAAEELAERLKLVSAERIREELNKLLMSDHPEKLRILHETGIDAVILPELYRHAEHFDSLINVLCHSPASEYIRWGILMSFISDGPDACGKADEAARILRSMKFDNETVYTVKKLLTYEDVPMEGISDREMRVLMNRAGTEYMELILTFKTVLSGTEVLPAMNEKDREICLKGIYKDAYCLYREILERGDCVSLEDMAVNGNDLLAAGIPAGKEIGRVLKSLLDAVLENPQLNEREKLMKMVAGIMNG